MEASGGIQRETKAGPALRDISEMCVPTPERLHKVLLWKGTLMYDLSSAGQRTSYPYKKKLLQEVGES